VRAPCKYPPKPAYLPALTFGVCHFAECPVDGSYSQTISRAANTMAGRPAGALPHGAADDCTETHSTCIVGAGPAGVQLGHLLQQAGRSFVIFERGARAATFFQKFPIHRQLNSINRRQTRMMPGEDPEFDLRHDHNSLLGDHVTGMPGRTEEYWVPADTLVDYMNDFAAPQAAAGHIRFCHEVQAVLAVEGCAGGSMPRGDQAEAQLHNTTRFVVRVAAHKPCDDNYNDAVKRTRFSAHDATRASKLPGQQASTAVCCGQVVMAHGMSVPNSPEGWIEGLHQRSVGYEELDAVLPNSSHVQGKSVLILGSGNAAYETADSLRNWASDLQIGARRVADSLARDTKYIGGIRGRRTTILDAFHLKSYEGISRLTDEQGYEDQQDVVAAAQSRGITRYALIPCGRGRARGADIGSRVTAGGSRLPEASVEEREGGDATCIVERDLRDGSVILGAWDATNPFMRQAAESIAGFKRKQKAPEYLQKWYSVLGVPAPTIATAPLQSLLGANSSANLRRLLPALLEATDGVTALASPGDMRKPWDLVIRHLGWKMDSQPLTQGGLNVSMMDVREALVFTDGRGSFKVRKTQEVGPGEPLSTARLSRYKGHYPSLNSGYESSSVPHLFFAGAASHGADRYRYGSPGGFIHGYRFTARALWRTLEHRYHGVEWAGGLTTFSWQYQYARDAPTLGYNEWLATRPLWGHLMNRINRAAGIYSMHGGALCDVLVFNRGDAGAGSKVSYYEEMTEDQAHERFSDKPRMIVMHVFGPAQFFPPWGRVSSSFTPQAPTAIDKTYSPYVSVFHPVLEFFSPGVAPLPHDHSWFNRQEGDAMGAHPPVARWSLERGSSRYHLQGDRHLDWSSQNHLPLLERFLLAAEEAAWNGRKTGKRRKGSIPNRYFDEVLDVRWDFSVAEQLGNIMPSYVGLQAQERATKGNMAYWKELAVEAASLGEMHNARAYLKEALGLNATGKLAAHFHFMLGVLDAKEQKLQDAKEHFGRSLKLNPDHLDARTNYNVLANL
jgi:hypothetical protein